MSEPGGSYGAVCRCCNASFTKAIINALFPSWQVDEASLDLQTGILTVKGLTAREPGRLGPFMNTMTIGELTIFASWENLLWNNIKLEDTTKVTITQVKLLLEPVA